MKLRRGAKVTLTIPVDKADGSPLPLLGGSSARWWMGSQDVYKYGILVTPKNVLLKKGTTNSAPPGNSGAAIESYVLAGETRYRVLVDLAKADTQSLVPGIYFHELEVIDAGGIAYTPELADAHAFELLNDLID